MVFSSLNFLFVFLPLALAAYFLTPNKHKNLVLFIESLVFYAWGEPIYIVLMLFSSLVDYVHGILIENMRGRRGAKLALLSSIIINLSLLGVFKYAGFLIGSVNDLFGLSFAQPNLPLPIGISFYTFQTMSYSIDVYRGETKAQRNFIAFGAYVSLFPQLIAGPIVRYQTIADQLTNRQHSAEQFAVGAKRFVAGLCKKVLLANNVALLFTAAQSAAGGGQLSSLDAWLGILAYGFQIYFDFSGYSDMAIGMGKMMGFDFLENFDYPYISRSITEFWRRWHISLGTWFREYVYIPLGGNKKGVPRQLFNLFVVWLLTGIWHGASWNFALWGLYFCALLIAEKLFLLNALKRAPRVISHIYTLFAVCIGWVIFAFDALPQGLAFLQTMFAANGAPLVGQGAVYALLGYWPLLLVCAVAATPLPGRLYRAGLARLGPGQKSVVESALVALGLLASVCYLVAGSYNPFLYFRF